MDDEKLQRTLRCFYTDHSVMFRKTGSPEAQTAQLALGSMETSTPGQVPRVDGLQALPPPPTNKSLDASYKWRSRFDESIKNCLEQLPGGDS